MRRPHHLKRGQSPNRLHRPIQNPNLLLLDLQSLDHLRNAPKSHKPKNRR
jgi:hypothetical protein